MLNLGTYTVGWISILPEAYEIAQCMLDETYGAPPPDDLCHFQLGRVGDHNVVIATLLDGQAGTSAATDVARNMIQSFPNIRVGFLVGIGGGVPSQTHDIRLGDVIVGDAIVQYDLNISLGHQSLGVAGSVNSLPPSLQTAIAHSGSDTPQGLYIKNNIDAAFQKLPETGIRDRYMRPDSRSDVLFRANIIHPRTATKCEAACANDPQSLVHRPERVSIDNNPAVFRGLIASMRQPIQDSLLRDKIAKNDGILCFEIEAAGLMSYFSCVAIRGISDYSDSHTNNSWRRYAAATAAAYAKYLISRLEPSQLASEKRISDLFFANEYTSSLRGLKLERVRKPSRFFKFGRVFAMVWIEPRMSRQAQQGGASSLKDEVFSKLRRFIVIRQSHHASLCVPIHTYGGQGVHKPDIKIEDHAKIYRSGDEPPPNPENIPLRDPVPITVEGSEEIKRLHPASLVNFGKIYTVEHGARVINMGYVHRSHSPKLELNWKSSIVGESRSFGMETSEKQQVLTQAKEELKEQDQGENDHSEKPGDEALEMPYYRDGQVLEHDMMTKQPLKINLIEAKLSNTAQTLPCPEPRPESQDQMMTGCPTTTSQFDLDLEHMGQQKSEEKHDEKLEEVHSESRPVMAEETSFSNEPFNRTTSSQQNNTKRHLTVHAGAEGKAGEGGDGKLGQHSNDNTGNWACPFFRLDLIRYTTCGNYALARFYDLIQHLEREHTLPENHYCPKCWSRYTLAGECRRHVLKCHNNSDREQFYYSELQSLKREIKCSKQKLRSKLQRTFHDKISKNELGWHFIWQEHFRSGPPVSAFAKPLLSEIAQFFLRQNSQSLDQVLHSVQDMAYNSIFTPRPRLSHPPESNSLVSGQVNMEASSTSSCLAVDSSHFPLDRTNADPCPSLEQFHIRETKEQDDDTPQTKDSRDLEVNSSSEQKNSSGVSKSADDKLESLKSGLLKSLYSDGKIKTWTESARDVMSEKPSRKRARAAKEIDEAYIRKEHRIYVQEETSEDYINLSHVRFIACPFYASDPEKYKMCLLEHDIRSMDDMNRHLIKHHPMAPYCPICGEVFCNTVKRDEHVRANYCQPQSFGEMEGVDGDRKARLEALGELSLDEVSQWERAYSIVLPGAAPRRTPYLTQTKERSVSLVRYHWAKCGHEYISQYFARNGLLPMHNSSNISVSLHALVLRDLLHTLETESRDTG